MAGADGPRCRPGGRGAHVPGGYRGGATVSTPLVRSDARNPAALLLTAATLFTAGARLRWDRLRALGANLPSGLPTYPFRRKRYWIEEPHDGAGAARGTDTSGRAAPAASGPRLSLGSLTPVEREAYLLAELRNVLVEPEGLYPERSFLDAGGDSFTPTLFITKVEEHCDLGLPPEKLPLDVPLAETISKLAANIARRDAEAEREPPA
ncbi:hypothetical protein [Streptomyces sp. NPDC053720]|uniref:acyl carrier protein n=1 Tax=Streptomyces sp. NPDC053720 TaxID=3154855 RepID=UPI003440662C